MRFSEHPDRDGFTVAYRAPDFAQQGFVCVTERMTEIQLDPVAAGFLLVGFDHLALDEQRAFDYKVERIGIGKAGDAFEILLDEIKQLLIGDDRRLDCFAESAMNLPRLEGLDDDGVDDDSPRLVERPDEILAAFVIDPGLSADARI